jgi:dipeptidase E
MRPRTIVAIGGGGLGREPYDARLDDYLLSLVDKPRPKIALLPQASAENKDYIVRFFQAYGHRADATWISLFDRTIQDLRSVLLSQNLIYVGGGNTANMLAVWRVHGVDEILKEAWQAGIVLCGVSAGANCWFESSVTDSFGRQLAPLHDGLALLPGSFCPHYDADVLRRPVYQELVTQRALPSGYAADDGVAVTFRDTEVSEVVTINPAANAWQIEWVGDPELNDHGDHLFVETKLTLRLLKSADVLPTDDDQISPTTGDPLSRKHTGHESHRPMTGPAGKGPAERGPTKT